MQTLFAAVTARFVQGDVWVARAGAVVQRPGPEREGLSALDPIGWASCSFDQPMSEPLAALSQDWLLPGLDKVLPDTVALLEPNPRFVEAYMAGLNIEMGRELLWRDYPLDDPRATYFRRFWHSAAAPSGAGDIAALADWGSNRLGSNAAAGVAAKQAVLLVRSGLFRRYPSAIVYMVAATRDARGRKPDIAVTSRCSAARCSPTSPSSVSMSIPTRGPGRYVVIEQQPTEPRFGFDVEVDLAATSARRPRRYAAGTRWAFNAAHMAQITRQQPVRVAIHASEC